MNIGIAGCGIIGSACKYGFEKNGHNVLVSDPRFGTDESNLKDCDIVFVCVPTPSRDDGSCDTSIVEKVVDNLMAINSEKSHDDKFFIAIKSTVEPGTTQRLIDKYDSVPDHRPRTFNLIGFVPEFLRERCAIYDFQNQDVLAIGAVRKDFVKLVVEIHGDYPQHIVQLTPTEAEILKYYSNTFNALRVVFANEMYEVCKALGADYNEVKSAFIKRGTTTDMYLDVNENFRGYGGMCLPKDTKALAHLSEKLGLGMDLFKCLDEENSKFKTTVFEGMRP